MRSRFPLHSLEEDGIMAKHEKADVFVDVLAEEELGESRHVVSWSIE